MGPVVMRFDMIKVSAILESRVCPVELPHPSVNQKKQLNTYNANGFWRAKTCECWGTHHECHECCIWSDRSKPGQSGSTAVSITSVQGWKKETRNCHPKPDIGLCKSVPEKVLILFENFLDFVEGIKDLFDTFFIGILTFSKPGSVDPV